MDFTLSDTQQLIQQSAQRFSQEQLAPHAADLADINNRPQFLANLKALADLGFMGLEIDSQYGGTEAGTLAFSIAITELAKGCPSTAVTVSVTNMVASVIQAMGSEQQKQTHLPKLCSGEYAAGAFCLTESQAGSDPSAMRCQAIPKDDHWLLNGSKLYITSAAYAGVFIVWAVTDKQAKKGKGISCFLVSANAPGLTIGKEERKMGQTGSATNEVIFDNVKVTQDDLLGELNQGFKIAVGELAGGRIGIASLALGIAQSAHEYAIDYVKERKQFGQSISDFQGIQWMLANSEVQLNAAKLLIYQAAQLKEQSLPFATQASMAKLFATEQGNKVCYDALQLLGGAGYLKDYPLEQKARDIRVTSIYEGTSEIQKLIIARSLLA
ncbi:acyl-CoA dehydrogenase family protein [Bermanella sp. R86510]|uniref:acyl-CoA dehydrogenase family protein n=1 Tax=unclassified Bermanella TaxID=2627862 RepID=UPI0037C51036